MLQSRITLEFQWLQAAEVDLLLTLQLHPRSAVALPQGISLPEPADRAAYILEYCCSYDRGKSKHVINHLLSRTASAEKGSISLAEANYAAKPDVSGVRKLSGSDGKYF